MTINEALKYGTDNLGQRDAMLLLCHVTGQSSAYVLLHGDKPLVNSAEYVAYVGRRKQGEPLQYVMGRWDFMGLTLRTDSRALIPRPETELLTEEALGFLQQNRVDEQRLEVLDLCTGSGCIAAAIAGAGDYNVTAVDVSADALALAQENGEGLGIKFIQSDLFTEVTGRFDLIISNPPYITGKEMDELDPTVLNYEPHLALHGGEDGMDVYRKLIPESLKFLKPGGGLFLEIGPAAVADIMTAAGFTDVQLKNDYAGLPRIIRGIAHYFAK
ncbi:MAG: peptide chain release factor N(5)-glutamine methyltransferase [Firmicutes bacterium]|nr:peptide chain release factor N(5)-glutamine methyltransferase [Bacillota bacterium]